MRSLRMLLVSFGLLLLNPPISLSQDFQSQQSVSLKDYFPADTGMLWEYEITLGDMEPLKIEEVLWRSGEDLFGRYRRSRFPAHDDIEKGKRYFRLAFVLEAPAARQGPLEWDGYRIRVLNDDLGVFFAVKELFWAFNKDGRFKVVEVRTYAPDGPRAPADIKVAVDGYSAKPVFFDGSAKKDIAMKVGDTPSEQTLFFEGNGGNQLYFIRKIKPSDQGDEPYVQHGFEEHLWFEKGRGLVKMEQKIGGSLSMTWKLINVRTFRGKETKAAELRR